MNETGTISITPAAWLDRQRAYQRRAPRGPITLRLDANEGEGPPTELIDAARPVFSECCSAYPDTSKLGAMLASRNGVGPQRVLVTAGADDALQRLCRVMLEPGRRALMTRPTFEMIPRLVRAVGGAADEVAWMDGPLPLNAMIERITPETSIIFVVSPNNPTGSVASVQDIRALSAAAPNALIVLDHAYVEFAEEDLTREVLRLPNVAVTKTLSKAWGLAGLRVGYLLASPEVIAWAKAAGLPYAVSGLSLAIAERILATREGAMKSRVERTREEVRELVRLLAALGEQPLRSQANFVLARCRNAPLLADLLASLGIAVRTFPDQDDIADCVRIGCPGNEAQFLRLSRALTVALKPAGILLDVDSTLETGASAALILGDSRRVRRLAHRCALGIVTSLPPERVERWILGSGLGEVIRVLPVDQGGSRHDRALKELGATCGWVIADTPGGVEAGREAGIAPFGIVPSTAADGADRSDTLMSSGAARVLASLSQLSEILS
mgnify:CR=1 FL=1